MNYKEIVDFTQREPVVKTLRSHYDTSVSKFLPNSGGTPCWVVEFKDALCLVTGAKKRKKCACDASNSNYSLDCRRTNSPHPSFHVCNLKKVKIYNFC